jgi:pyruvate dehydrogenase E1 component alpha subunit
MAAVWKLPVIYLCENNRYAMGTACARAASNTKYYARGDLIPGMKLDGNNYFHMKEGFKWAK